MSDLSWLTTIFCPLLGVLISNARGMAPVKALIAARRNKKLGEKNFGLTDSMRALLNNIHFYDISSLHFHTGPLSPIPFALITNNCIGWTMYAILNGDYFIFMSNCFSMILGFGLCLTAIHILEHTDHKQNPRDKGLRLKVEGILMISASFWLTIVFLVGIVLRAPEYTALNIKIVGSFSNICSLVFYAAPLTNIAEIIRRKDSSSLYAPAIAINLISCLLWFFYGFIGINAMIVWIPNTVGGALCIFELFIVWLYPPHKDGGFDGLLQEEQALSTFAVYSSSRHMSSADLIPLLGAFLNPDNQGLPVATPESNKLEKFKSSLDMIAEEKPRNRAVTTSAVVENPQHDEVTRAAQSSKC